MSDNNPWEVPRHDNPLWHSKPNPTQQSGQGATDNAAGADGWQARPFSADNPGIGGLLFGYKFMWISILLSIITGPLGLFYVSILNGIAALVVLPIVVPFLARLIAAASGASADMVPTIGIPIIWCFTVPWAIIATKRHNAKL